MNIFKKKRVLLSDFNKEVGKIATKVNEKYYATKIEYTHEHDGNNIIQFCCYINNYSWYTGYTIKEAIDSLKKATNKKDSKVKKETRDIVIEQ